VRQPEARVQAIPRADLTLPLEVGTPANGGFADPAFGENKSRRIHRWVPWIAGFSGEFVADVCARYLTASGPAQRALVVDPFAGVGTTLIEAYAAGHDVVGFEINPFASLAARVKLRSATLSSRHLTALNRALLECVRDGTRPRVRQEAQLRLLEGPLVSPPPGFRSRIPFFSPAVQRKVLRAIEFVNGIAEAELRDVFRLAFGAVMVSLSNYSYEPSLGSRPGAGKPLVEDADVAQVIATRVAEIAEDTEWFQRRLHRLGYRPQWQVHETSFFRAGELLADESVDLVVTSPPYLNNYHYVRNTRPQLFWLGFVKHSRELRRFEEESFGRFWQTVRDDEPWELGFDLPELERVIAQVRQRNPGRKAYGGPGWANYVVCYFRDCRRFCEVLARLLRPGGRAVVVIGNSVIQGVEVKTDALLAAVARQFGLQTEEVMVLREKRVGSSIVGSEVRQGGKRRIALYESALVLRKD
jgi:hypothetical protein